MQRGPSFGRDESQFTGARCRSNAKVRLGRLAAGQFGRVRYNQLRALGVSERTIGRWRTSGYLHLELPRVYAVGHPGGSTESDLAAALLYAGPGAMLSAATAIWWLGLLNRPPQRIFVATPRRVKDIGKVVVQRERRLARIWHNRLPVTTPSRSILDFAAAGPDDLLRLVLANADYHGLLDLHALQASLGRGTSGSAALRDALRIHLPALARTRSQLEILLLTLCQTQRLPMPQVNVYLAGHLVDAYWPAQELVLEVDGLQGHRSRAQLERDHQRDLELRALGYIVLRYTWRQLTETPAAVATDLRRHL